MPIERRVDYEILKAELGDDYGVTIIALDVNTTLEFEISISADEALEFCDELAQVAIRARALIEKDRPRHEHGFDVDGRAARDAS